MTQGPRTVAQKANALSQNLWWSWQADVRALFEELDPEAWQASGHNPVALLRRLEGSARMNDAKVSARIEEAYDRLQAYLGSKQTWGHEYAGVLHAGPVAYFSAEYGIHESLPIYSGGLGVLAGDHLKSASDLGIPLVGVGLLYREGYFRQHIDVEGWQKESYPLNDPGLLPVSLVTKPDGERLVVGVETRDGALHAQVWLAQIGRVALYLLDSDVAENSEDDRKITARLYGGDSRVRIRQELLLGVGGFRALSELGIHPRVVHLNEGHCAFATLEMVRQRMQAEGVGFLDACQRVARSVVFTTHTPVPAGHDRFDADLVEEHLGPIADALHLDDDALIGLGRVNPEDTYETFCMTVLALKLSHRANGVSALHGEVSRRMWHHLWQGRAEHEVPIGHITNGVHQGTWLAPRMRALLDRQLGPDWSAHISHPLTWRPLAEISPQVLWSVRLELKSLLVDYVRRITSLQAEGRGEPGAVVEALRTCLHSDDLIIGFARRFATYKRATLLFSDLDWLDRLVNDPKRPVRFVFAGKAHPKDEGGKAFLQRVHKTSRDPRFLGKILFVENYDIDVGRHLVQGVDVWLNNPRRPLEASGTSGEKVALNGGLHCSVLDGWWAEAYDGMNGFAIGRGETHRDDKKQDARDAVDLRAALSALVPVYYDRDPNGLPVRWLERVQHAIQTLSWRFNSDRMLIDYATGCYLPAALGVSKHLPHVA